MNQRHSKAYAELARLAATEAGLKAASPEAAADDHHARELRDARWEEYERMLRDTQTYTLDKILEALTDRGVEVGRSSVDRDRVALLDKERIYELAAGKARAVIEAATASGESDLLKAGRLRAGQMIFNALSGLSSAALEGLKPGQVVNMIEVLGKLSKAHAETGLITQKLAEARTRFEQTMADALKRKKGTLTQADLDEATELIFGKVA